MPLPLLVFVHGLGGSIAQFSPLLTSLVNAAPCLAIDLPGCGLSEFNPKTADAYTTDALAELVAVAIEKYRDAENGQKVILIGHSMGCSIAALLASSTSPHARLISSHVVGFVAICPRAEPLTKKQASQLRWVRFLPVILFNLFRIWDRRGGTESDSVLRYVGKDADAETKRLQLRFNEQSKSAVFLKMLMGMKPDYSSGNARGGLPGKEVWKGLKIPTFCIAGEADHVCPPHYVDMIASWLGRPKPEIHQELAGTEAVPTAAGEAPVGDVPSPPHTTDEIDTTSAIDSSAASKPASTHVSESRQPSGPPTLSQPHAFVLKTTILPSPASHALLYATTTVRILSGLLQSFFATHIDHRLSLGWQLQHLSTEGKWDVKNLAKWTAIDPVSAPIGKPEPVFRAMKTLREVDERHTPRAFVKDWGVGGQRATKTGPGVRMVVDISHESPVYDPKGLEEGGVEYHKFPTVSKLPPTSDEVRAFVAIVDTLRAQIAAEGKQGTALLGVHCHYGFNRTGFFIVSYLVERLGYGLQAALDEFADKRSPGIRHEHFVNELWVRYCVGLQRRATISE